MESGLEILDGKFVFDTLFIDYRVMVVTAIVSIILFLAGMYIHLSKWGRATPEGATGPIGAFGALKFIIAAMFAKGIGKFLEVLILDVAFQRRTFRRRKLEWFMHILIFWGWIGLLILTIVAAIGEFYSPFSEMGGHAFFAQLWLDLEPLNEIFGYMIVAGLAIAIVRRLFFRSKDVQARNADVDWILVVGLLIVVVTGFYAQDIRVDAGVMERELISDYPAGFFNNFTVLFHEVFTLLFCVAYLPFSKYLHMMTAPMILLVNHGGE